EPYWKQAQTMSYFQNSNIHRKLSPVITTGLPSTSRLSKSLPPDWGVTDWRAQSKLKFEVSPSPTKRSGATISGNVDGAVELEDGKVEFAILAFIITNWAEPILLITDRVQLSLSPLVTVELVAGAVYPRSPVRE